MKNRKKLRVLIIAIAIVISSVFIYKVTIAPKLYNKYLNQGIKYLMDEQYEEAILAFDKAIKIEPKTTEARVYQSKAYIGNEEIDKAVEVLEEAQKLDITNEELLKEILEILNKIDPDIAYEFLDRFIVTVGKDNISQEIKDILDLADETPSEPIVDPEPGTYVNPISIKLKQDKLKIGHSYYYTLDGSEPNKNSEKYRGQIKISKNTTIKLIGYNINDDKTDVFTLEYIIDEDIIDEVKDSISKGESLINETIVGNEIGNIPQEYKNKLQLVIDKAKDVLNENYLNYNDAKDIKNEIEDSIKEFKDNIIKPTDKSKLKSIINEAENLYNNSTEGNNDGQYKFGSKSLLKSEIDKAKVVYDNKSVKQDEIDKKVDSLKQAINNFKNSKVSTFTKEKALQYAIGKYGPPVKDHKFLNELEQVNNYRGDDYWEVYDAFAAKYEAYGKEACLNEYEFKSGLLTENGKKYYVIYNIWNAYLDTHVFLIEMKVYEDGTIKSNELF